jgi:pimeloyl-ACP methyl ester carboxylesterase
MGGYIAFEIIRQAPSRVVKLALLDTSARPDTIEQTDARLHALAEARTHFMAVALRTLSSLLHPRRREDSHFLDVARRMAASVGLRGYERQLRIAISRPDSRALLGSLQIPTLVLVGDSDPLTPPECAREIAAAVRGSILRVVADCGHLSPIEQPEQVTAALVKWVRD